MYWQDGVADKSTTNAKLKITIPRQPDLETAHRAHRIRFEIYTTLINCSKKNLGPILHRGYSYFLL